MMIECFDKPIIMSCISIMTQAEKQGKPYLPSTRIRKFNFFYRKIRYVVNLQVVETFDLSEKVLGF